MGDIDLNLRTETTYQKIRDEYISNATVTVVLIGPHTWRRKFVDWEIYSSLRHTDYNGRCGLLGIFLPTYPLPGNKYNPYTIPPRLHDNIECGYAVVRGWSTDPNEVKGWIHQAFTETKEGSATQFKPRHCLRITAPGRHGNNHPDDSTIWMKV